MRAMLISGAEWTVGTACRRLAAGEYEAAWQGCVYFPGCAVGAESVKRLLMRLPDGLRDVPKGVYFLAVLHKPTGRRYAFVDSSGLFHAFVSASAVSNSFIALAKHAGAASADLDAEALVEFFHSGHVLFGKTLLAGIRRIGCNQIIRLDPSGEVAALDKAVPDISSPPRTSPEDALRTLVASAREERVSVDLTGGMDSRMLAVILDSLGANFELALSGSPGNRDIYVAEQVARTLKRRLNVCYHDISDFPASVRDSFLACDGLFNIARAHRHLQAQRARAKRGITLAVSGAGGEVLRDYWWWQDLPFYSRRTADLSRLYSLRFFPVRLRHEYLAPRYRTLSEQFRSRFLASLAPFVHGTNTQTYDRIVYCFRNRDYAGRMLSNCRDILSLLPPYVDRDVVAFGYALPRATRFFDYYHRETITRFNPQAARVPTTERRMTVSSRCTDISVDILRYVADRTKRIARRFEQRVFQKTRLLESPDHPGLSRQVREVAAKRRTLERLKEHQILAPHLRPEDVRDDYWGNLLGLDMLLEELGD